MSTDLQFDNEIHYNRKHINTFIDDEIRADPAAEAKVYIGLKLLKIWIAKEHYPSKRARLDQLEILDLEQLVRTVFCSVAYCQTPELFVNITAQLAAKLGFDNKRDSIITTAEILAVLCESDAFDLIRTENDRIQVLSRIPLSTELLSFVRNSLYLPPMVCKPTSVNTNYESPFLTHNDSLVLGADNAHTEDICLDAINIQNKVCFKLSTEFLDKCEEVPSKPLDTMKKQQAWTEFMRQSAEIYDLMCDQGNKFWFPNKVDKRGRMYTLGYHINPQGSPYKKAMLELHHQELVEGVPSG